jgi:hypothetical protein
MMDAVKIKLMVARLNVVSLPAVPLLSESAAPARKRSLRQ